MTDGNTQDRLRAAVVHHQSGRLHEAVALYATVLAEDPNNPDALHLMGVAKHQSGESEAGVELIRRAIEIRPSVSDFHANVAGVFAATGRLAEAIEFVRQAVALRPSDVHLKARLAKYLAQFGILRIEQDRPDEALAPLEESVRLRPDSAEALANLGLALSRLKRHGEAIRHYERALSLKPDLSAVHTNLGASMLALGRAVEAVAAHRRARALKPDWLAAKSNLAIALAQLDQTEEALALHEEVLCAQNDNPTSLFNRGIIRLTRGDFPGGWADYEARFRVPELKGQQTFPQPRWASIADDIAGKTILVHAEQGLGDTIQFVRYIPHIVARRAQIILQCDPLLVRLLRESFPGMRVVSRGDSLPAFDLHVPIMSLPCVFGTTLDTIPASVPYLSAPPPTPRDGPGLRVGLVWSGNPDHYNDRQRSIRLEQLLPPLAEVSDVRYFSLQKGPGVEQLSRLRSDIQVTDLAPAIQDFADSASAIRQLDIVISVDTSIAHLAGALGATTWTLLPTPADFRWMTGRDDSPWYPTMRLFRQPRAGDWDSVVKSAAAELARTVARLARDENP